MVTGHVADFRRTGICNGTWKIVSNKQLFCLNKAGGQKIWIFFMSFAIRRHTPPLPLMAPFPIHVYPILFLLQFNLTYETDCASDPTKNYHFQVLL